MKNFFEYQLRGKKSSFCTQILSLKGIIVDEHVQQTE